MAQLATGIYARGTLPLTEVGFEFPTVGNYQIQAIQRGAQWIKVRARAEDKEIYDFVLSRLGFLDSAVPHSVKAPYHTKIVQNTNNFSRFFEEGKSLIRQGLSRTRVVFPNPIFYIQSPHDLLEANLTLKDFSEYVISRNLFPLQNGELTESQRLRLTQTKFLAPLTLSEMTGGEISIEEALLLITCLGLKKNNKPKICVCDPATGNFNQDFQHNMLTSHYKLIFLDPAELLESLLKSDFDLDKDYSDTKLLFEGTKLIVKNILGSEAFQALFSSPSDLSQSRLVSDLIKASVDHNTVWQIIDNLETYFPFEQREAALRCKSDIVRDTQSAFKKCQELAKNLPNKKKFFDELKNIEAKNRLTMAAFQKGALQEKFNKFRAVILKFLDDSSCEYQINDSTTLNITWVVQGVEIKERMEITKACAIARRVLCPTISASSRSDLVYFSLDSDEESVVSRWKLLCQQNNLSDRQLANHLLSLYQGNEIPMEFRPFLSFLMILLLGKEPMYDSASFAANFILLLSIKLGVHTFEEALRKMPMIPQGAIAAKQFLLHVSGKPLDVSVRVQYKDKKQVPESTFLSTSTSFLGLAHDWIQVYDDVATTALECCRRLFFQDHDLDNPSFVQLQTDLAPLFEKDKLEIWDIPLHLRLFSERKALNKNSKNKVAHQLLDQKNKFAARYLRAVGQTVDDENNAAEQCARFLMKGVNLNNPSIQALQQIIDKQDSENWQNWMLSKLKEKKGPGYESMKQAFREWNPSTVFRANNIDPYDYSYAGISKMDKAWEDYFRQCMSEYQEFQNFDKLIQWTLNKYRIPVFYELASAIDPENAVNEEDPLAKWAISYILDRHPLKRE